MLRFIVILLTAATLLATSAFAGPGSGHSHGPAKPVTEIQAIYKAEVAVFEIVQKGKLDASWSEVEATEAQKKKFKSGQEWVVTFNNPSEPDPEKKTLYVFLSLDGQYRGANFSGS